MGETDGLVSKEYAQHNTDKLDSPPQGIARLRPLRVGFSRVKGSLQSFAGQSFRT